MFNYHIKSILLFISFFLFATNVNAQAVNTLFHQAGDPVAGNPKGNVTVVEFFDYQCSHCSLMAPILDSIIKSNPNVRIVFKEYPIRGTISTYAARAALAANKQGKYYRFSRALLTTNQLLTETSILKIAEAVGLNVNQLKRDMNSASVTDLLRSNYKLAHQLNVTGTPAFLIGKTNAKDANNVELVLGEMSRSELQSAINKSNRR